MSLLKNKLIKNITHDPEKYIADVNLIYSNNSDFIYTRHKKGDSFIYRKENRLIENTKTLKWIKSLIIPPNWENVKICNKPNGHLLAVGRDSKNRKQYLYHPKWAIIRNNTKFYKMLEFGKILPKIRERVEKDLIQKKWSLTKVLALVVKLLEETHVRIGNIQYEKRNKTYGLTTLRSRHLTKDENKLRIEFVGKRGKRHKITLRNKKLVKLVNRCEEIPGWKLFKYYDDNGEKQQIDSSQVNDYIQKISADCFTAKDFRTWAASVICLDALYDYGYKKKSDINKKTLLKAIDTTAKELGNTRSVCRKYYIHPKIISNFQDGSIKKYFKKLDNPQEVKAYSSQTESVFLELISTYKIKIS